MKQSRNLEKKKDSLEEGEDACIKLLLERREENDLVAMKS
jgi:hypothetical protein